MFSLRCVSGLTITAALVIMLGSTAIACGPFFPNGFISQGGESRLAFLPAGDFAQLVSPLIRRDRPPWQPMRPDKVTHESQQSVDVAMSDLNDALIAAGMSKKKRGAVLEANLAVRNQLRDALTDLGAAGQPLKLHPELPAEFALYQRGLAFWRRAVIQQRTGGEIDHAIAQAARACWRQLLLLPAEQRKYRTIWATYMLGRSYMDIAPQRAVAWFHVTRELARQGYSDNLGLAMASVGFEARARMLMGEYATAIDLYLSMGDEYTDIIMPSLRLLISRAWNESPEARTLMARDPGARRIVTAYLLAYGYPWERRMWTQTAQQQFESWITALREAGADVVDGGAQMAWLAYRSGEIDLAGRLLQHVSPDDPIGMWILSRLLIREGDWARAAETLAKLAPMFPVDETWSTVTDEGYEAEAPLSPRKRVLAELGTLQFAREQYVEAMQTLLRAGYWTDAAYIADRVLTADELKGYVDRNWRDANDGYSKEVQNLLARRLTRIGRWRDARSYFDADHQQLLDRYVDAIRDGNAQKDGERLWQAAVIANDHGMELLGTELAPDWFAFGGMFSLGSFQETMLARQKSTPLPVTSEELSRLRKHASEIDKRYHYRYTAADHAWTAVSWMPDNDDRTARMLCIAGSWLKIQDPQAADRFYKALVNRCGKTDLGRQAAKLRWFPKLMDDREAPDESGSVDVPPPSR